MAEAPRLRKLLSEVACWPREAATRRTRRERFTSWRSFRKPRRDPTTRCAHFDAPESLGRLYPPGSARQSSKRFNATNLDPVKYAIMPLPHRQGVQPGRTLI